MGKQRKERSDKGKKKVPVQVGEATEKFKRDKEEANKWLAIDSEDGSIAESFDTKEEANAWIEDQNSGIDDGEPTFFLRAPEKVLEATIKKVNKLADADEKKAYDKPAGSGVRDLGKLHPDLSRYRRVKTIEGRVHVDIADAVAIELREMTLDQVYEYAAKVLGIPASDLFSKYSKLNQGMQRMNCGNRLRAHLRAIAKREAASVTDLGTEE